MIDQLLPRLSADNKLTTRFQRHDARHNATKHFGITQIHPGNETIGSPEINPYDVIRCIKLDLEHVSVELG